MFTIRPFPFDKNGQAISAQTDGGSNWPVIYLINSNSDIYIGETTSFERRFREHLRFRNSRFKGFTEIRFAYDGTENKSAILDYESNLIRLYAADGKFQHIHNANPGQSQDHDYSQRPLYYTNIKILWDQLHKLNLTKQDYESVRNSCLYKFSPFTTLTSEQRQVMKDILEDFLAVLISGKTGGAVVNGGAGTGKSLVAVKIIDILLNIDQYLVNWKRSSGVYGSDWCSLLSRLKQYITTHGPLRIAYIAPQQSFNADMQKTFGKMPWTGGKALVHNTSNIVYSYPTLEPFDIILVDEAHRLKHRKGIGKSVGLFDCNCQRLGLPHNATQLDVILARAKYSCLFYDSDQSIKNSDITPAEFEGSLSSLGNPFIRKNLSVQMRCLGGGDYVKFIEDVFSGKLTPNIFKDYDFHVYDDVQEMVDEIHLKNETYGLCRTLSGFAWPWITKKFIKDNKTKLAIMGGPNKGKNVSNLLKLDQFDISIGESRFVWNIREKGWVTSPGAVDEIGCIHTSQGYDLNYCGVILGPDIRYDKDRKRIIIDSTRFCDPFYKQNRRTITDADIQKYIVNSYRTMLLRGILGCYVYAMDDDLRDYLKQCEEYVKSSPSWNGNNVEQKHNEEHKKEESSKSPSNATFASSINPEMDPDQWFGKIIQRRRIEIGLSQEELAFRSGISRSYMGVIERGEKSPSIDTIAKVAKGLGESISDLFTAFNIHV